MTRSELWRSRHGVRVIGSGEGPKSTDKDTMPKNHNCDLSYFDARTVLKNKHYKCSESVSVHGTLPTKDTPMKLTSITVGVNIPISLGKDKSLRPFVSVGASLEEGDDPKKCSADLHKMAMEMYTDQAAKELKLIHAMRAAVPDEGTPSTPEATAMKQVKALKSALV